MSKYKAKKVTYNNIDFDSKAECDYYKHLETLREKGYIQKITLQPKYLLQEKFIKNGKKYRDMYYIADFEIIFTNGITIVVDVKGLPTEVAKLKRKLFDYKYRGLKLYWIKKKAKRWVKVC